MIFKPAAAAAAAAPNAAAAVPLDKLKHDKNIKISRNKRPGKLLVMSMHHLAQKWVEIYQF